MPVQDRFCAVCGSKLSMLLVFEEAAKIFCPKDGLEYSRNAEQGVDSPEKSLQAKIDRLEQAFVGKPK